MLTPLAAPPPISSPTHTRTSRRALLIDRRTIKDQSGKTTAKSRGSGQKALPPTRGHAWLRDAALGSTCSSVSRRCIAASCAIKSNQTQTHSSQTKPNQIRSSQIDAQNRCAPLAEAFAAVRRPGKARPGKGRWVPRGGDASIRRRAEALGWARRCGRQAPMLAGQRGALEPAVLADRRRHAGVHRTWRPAGTDLRVEHVCALRVVVSEGRVEEQLHLQRATPARGSARATRKAG
jgi:hypothetical protein